MSTIIKIEGLRVVIYTNDHRPAHVHVIGSDCEAVFDLHCPEGPPELRENYRFSIREVSRIKANLTDVLKKLCQSWSTTHGNYK